MCGGAGTRLDRGEKPLFEVGGVPMVERVLDALDESRIDTAYAVTSPETPETADRLRGRAPIVETDGEGYVADLTDAVGRVGRPVVTVAADLPLLTSEPIDRAIDDHDGGALTVCVPAVLKRRLGVSVDTTRTHGGRELAPTGLNVVGQRGGETMRASYDARLAVNVNRPGDAAVASAFADSIDGGASDGS
ncbi:adenosylcobinamide-phosphate guanylyltransferase [Natronomonas moolapensis 8.8.11]|uniref:Adenosylcobinamide-phosphate guanylyltransferase n=1 Tax=Natronomonas moolapensis (strain DSM 18674 / CECT 7526 / JCM 14361 / 8.8.11) TaxID=268739 RepID=M1XR09_NATM8|nr:NTP transferase domain-containing protein [Natronomonas moolapensis]CCQ36617.1 adenosylcobinamide-phosphate guanylyltransferase [Natronomonas moolapensis 8.8.11]